MPLFFSIFFLALLGVAFAHASRRLCKVETTNRRWILVLIANGLIGALFVDTGNWAIVVLATYALFVLSARVLGRVPLIWAMGFGVVYFIASLIIVILLMLLFGPEALV